MTTTAPAAAGVDPTSVVTPRLLRGLTANGPVGIDEHRELHGPIPRVALRELIAACSAVALRGRGGAGFPVATKLSSLAAGRRIVVVNGTESEPASVKDRMLLSGVPHLVLDGAALVAGAIGARQVRLAVHDEAGAAQLAGAIAERADRRMFRVDVIGGGFVSGEARSLIRALDGGPAIPPGRRTLPTVQGVGGAPTFLSNAETFAQLAVLAELGTTGYAAVGTRDEPGTTLLSIGGAVEWPGVLEVAMGASLGSVLTAAGARAPGAVIIGGYHGSWLAHRPDLRLSHRSLAAAGGTLGAGVVLVVGTDTCALGELTRVASWLANESANQCGPCMFGLPAIVEDLLAVTNGQAGADRRVVRHARMVTGRGACAHPDGAARFVTSGMTVLAREIELHRRRGNCGRPILGQLPLASAARR